MRPSALLSVLCALCLAITCSAVTIDVSSISGAWSNVVPGSGITAVNGSPTSTLRWPTGAATQSGYDFTKVTPPPPNLTVAEGVWFKLGDFVHINNPIIGTTLTSVDLDITLGMVVPTSGTAVSKLFTYGLNHNETSNTSPCTGLGLPNPSLSVCDDLVTIVNPTPNQTFNVAGVDYTLKLGFSTDGGATLLSYFQTRESLSNLAGIYGKFTTEVVPEPGFYGVLAMGLAGLYCAARRRRSAN
jgi:hypothetical protein